MLFANSCGIGRDSEEVARLCSPDNKVEAVFERAGGGGATSGFTYALFIVKKGMKVMKSDDVLFQADHLKNLHLNWKSDRILEISYDEARIFKFTNFWQSSNVQNYQYVVELKLVSNKEGHALSKKDRFLEGYDMSGRIIHPDSSNDSISLEPLRN